MAEDDKKVELRFDGRSAEIRLAGSWRITDNVPMFNAPRFDTGSEPVSIKFSTAELGDWDSSLIAFVAQVYSWANREGIEIDATRLPENVSQLASLSSASSPADRGGTGKSKWIERVGHRSIEHASNLGETFAFLGDITLSMGRFLIGRSRMRSVEFWTILQDVGPSALPIVTLIAFLVGLILAFLGATVLTQFGAGIYSAHLVGFGMLRELGAMMTAIVMIGRTGASFAASIGTMKVGEELDALETMGVSTTDYVVLPKLLALFFMMPLLTVYADIVGIAGGMLVASLLQDITPRLFINTLISAVHLGDFTIGLFKATVFGGLIAVTGCLRGIECGTNAEAVGKATTSAVVTGTTLVILANALIDWLQTI